MDKSLLLINFSLSLIGQIDQQLNMSVTPGSHPIIGFFLNCFFLFASSVSSILKIKIKKLKFKK